MISSRSHDDLVCEITALVMACLNGDITDDGVARLDALLRDDDEACRIYVRVMNDSSAIRRWGAAELSASRDAIGAPTWSSAPDSGWEDLSDAPPTPLQERSATPFLVLGDVSVRAPLGFVASGWPVAYLIATVVLGVGLTLAALVHSSRPDAKGQLAGGLPSLESQTATRVAVARITDMVDCVWDREGLGIRDWGLAAVESEGRRGAGWGQAGDSGQQPVASGQKPSNRQPLSTSHYPLSTIHYPLSTVSLGDVLALKSGLLELTYDTGARVILQGPVSYKVDSIAGGYLTIGKLTAKLEKRGQGTGDRGQGAGDRGQSVTGGPRSASHRSLSTLHSPLFTITTPTAIVTDLGTEFGVEVDDRGITTSHVFRGLVRVENILTTEGGTRNAVLLHADESVRVEKAAGPVTPTSDVSPSRFARAIRKQPTKSLDLTDIVAGGNGFSGRRDAGIAAATGQLTSKARRAYHNMAEYPVGDGKYHAIEDLPLIDGVFVPDGSRGPMQVDSAGHTYAAFRTTTNTAPADIWAAGPATAQGDFPDVARLGGIDYSKNGRGALVLQSNVGITFDLQAIRRAHPGWRIVSFHAMAGNSEPASDRGESVCADMLILVDGKERFKRREINSFNGVFPVTIHLDDDCRFLTLATTDGGDGESWDWITYGNPRLELVPNNSDSTDRRMETDPRDDGLEQKSSGGGHF